MQIPTTEEGVKKPATIGLVWGLAIRESKGRQGSMFVDGRVRPFALRQDGNVCRHVREVRPPYSSYQRAMPTSPL